MKESIPYISKMAIGNAGMECRNSKRVPPFSPHLFRKGKKNQQKLKTTKKLRTPENPLQGRNDGRLMPWGSCDFIAPQVRSGRRPCRHRTHWARWAIGDTGFLCNGIIWLSLLLKSILFPSFRAQSRTLPPPCCSTPMASKHRT